MATYLDFLSFKASLPWYKKILFPILLNKQEFGEYFRIVTEEQTDIDRMRDHYLYCWNQYLKDPNYDTEHWMNIAKRDLEILLRKEEYERNNPE